MDRVALVTDPGRRGADILLEGAADALRACDDIELGLTLVRHPPRKPRDLRRLAARLGAPLELAPDQDVHHPGSLECLRDRGIDVALSVFCVQRFRPAFLERFQYTVNYHNGFLPGFRGLGATEWSVYLGQAESGFTFHRMVEGLDAGPTLLSAGVPIGAQDRPGEIELRKARVAAARMPEILDAIRARAPGEPQKGAAHYYSRRDSRALQVVSEPSALTADDLQRRLRAFGRLVLQIDGGWHRVTELRNGPGWLGFRCADGTRVHPTRVKGMPAVAYRILRTLGHGNGKPPRL